MPHVADAGGVIRVRAAGAADAAGILGLVEAAGLPLDGVAEAVAAGCVRVATAPDGAVVGAAAVEPYGDAGLLRSVVVSPDARGDGIGGSLVAAAEKRARALGVRELWLLTETAADWFPRLGYEPADRGSAPAGVATSHEFMAACPASAVAMRRNLAHPDPALPANRPGSVPRTGRRPGQAGPARGPRSAVHA